MMFKVNPVRKVTFEETFIIDPENESEEPKEGKFSVTFHFAPAEDIDYVQLRKKMEDKTPLEFEDEKGKISKTDVGSYNAFLYNVRTSLIDWSGISDMEGNPLPVRDEKGKIIEANQLAVFEAVRLLKPAKKGELSLMDKVTSAYVGHKGKN